MARILLVRHAESTWNAEGRMQGWSDPPLSPAGREQAAAFGHHLAGMAPDLVVAGVVSSDLRRAVETARAIATATGAPPPRTDARLRERELGLLTGLTEAEARRDHPVDYDEWRRQRRPRPPGGESTDSVLRRARAALDGLAGDAAGDTRGTRDLAGDDARVVVVVAHGGLISVLEREAGLGPGGFANLAGRWVTLEPDGSWRLGERFEPEEAGGTAVGRPGG